MSIFDVLWLFLFVGGGAAIGHALIPNIGIVLGATTGAIALYFIARINSSSISALREESTERDIHLIPVLPKNYRSIAIYALESAHKPTLLINNKQETDFSETGPLTQKKIRSLIDFEIRDDVIPILGFHDHPNEMWINERFKTLAEHCEKQGWLKIEGPAS